MHVLEATFAPTCNVFYLRRDLEAVGGFDETFRQPVGEDTDLAWRVKEAVGRELLFAEQALVYHDVRRRTFAQAVKETYRWAGVPPVVKRHPVLAREAWHRGYFLRISHERVLLGVLGLLIGIVFPPALLLTLPWLRYRVIRGFLSKQAVDEHPIRAARLRDRPSRGMGAAQVVDQASDADPVTIP